MDNNELEIGGIIKQYKHRTILSDVYIKCKTGEVIGILGRNGSGKSTLLQIIFGTLPADDKTIRINHTVYSEPYLKGNLISYLPQNSFLPKNISIQRLIGIFIDDKEAQVKVLKDKRVNKYLNKNISELSGGELRYLEILLIINLPVKFVLLDEPFSGIEPIYKEMVKGLINSSRKEKGFLITDHDYMNIIDTSDTLFLINKGVCRKIEEYRTELEEYNYLPKGTFTDKDAVEPDARPFETDQQTLKDLDLFNTYQESDLFTLFNKVTTPGGKNKLAKIFNSPSQNIQELESRRNTIKFLEEKGISLSIDRKQIAAIEYYLQSDIGLFKNASVTSFISYVKYYFRPSGDYYTVETGIKI